MVMASMGLGLVTYISSQERLDEIVRQIARGMSRGQVASLLVIEAMTVAIAGILVGLVAGVLPAYLYNASIARREGLTLLPPVDFSSSMVLLAFVSLMVLWIGSLAAAKKASGVRLEQAFRVRR